jgi:hypothetical protein
VSLATKLLAGSLALLSLSTQLLFSQTRVDIPAAQDNTLYENAAGSLSNGAGSGFFAGRSSQANGSIRRGVISFNIASTVPSGAHVDSVRLRLHLSQTQTAVQQGISLHRLLASWGEGSSNATLSGGGSGAPAATGDATWIHRFFDTSFWSAPGGDFSPDTSATNSVADTGFYVWGPSPTMRGDVQAWLDNPAANYGWIVWGNEATSATSKRFDSRQHPDTSHRPALTVWYSISTGIVKSGDPQGPHTLTLSQNYPNPFNPSTTITYFLPSESRVRLEIFNSLGQSVATLIDDERQRGTYHVIWHATQQPSGLYFCRIIAGKFVDVKKLSLIR